MEMIRDSFGPYCSLPSSQGWRPGYPASPPHRIDYFFDVVLLALLQSFQQCFRFPTLRRHLKSEPSYILQAIEGDVTQALDAVPGRDSSGWFHWQTMAKKKGRPVGSPVPLQMVSRACLGRNTLHCPYERSRI